MLSAASRRLIQQGHRQIVVSSCSSLDAPVGGLRYYHATERKEILPIIAGLGILFIGRYSYKAMKRMDDEWDDYQWKLQQYERQHGGTTVDAAKYPDGTLAIDVGTFYLKMAKDKTVLVNREGSRFSFAGVVVDGDEVLVGQRAYEKYWERSADAVSLAGQDADKIPLVVASALEDALERANAHITKIRPIVTVPPLKWDAYETAFHSILPTATFVPEPVAAIWGAQAQKELPESLQTPVLVIDIGALETTMSVVQKNVISSTTAVDTIGGDLFVDAVVDMVTGSNVWREDRMALQRITMAAHDAVAELNTNMQAQLNIPYIGMDLDTKQPQHLDERVARTVVESKVANKILTTIEPSKLSSHMPAPTSLPLMWMSILTQLLEVTELTPMQLSHVLLVGGGAKHALMVSSIKECFVMLQGNADNVVVPSSPSEMVALGAASILQNYSYDTTSGLVRQEEE